MKEYRKYFGKKFYQQKDGYWANMMPIQAHRWVWINHHGCIPNGMDIHHKDGDKSNNEIENLEMLSRSDHLKKHWQEGRFDLEKRRIQLSEARKWLKTNESKEKQRIGAIESSKYRKLFEISCEVCNKIKITKQPWTKFCSASCEKKDRRNKGLDNILKICLFCFKHFLTDKNQKHKYCSISCGAKNSAKNRNICKIAK